MILSRSQFKREFEEIYKDLESMYHTYLQQEITYPAIDTLSLHFSYMFLSSLGYSKEKRHTYAVSQVLIQLGLDSHDQISVKELSGQERVAKDEQLTILSGDLFSGYYYHYLARKNEIELIRKWAEVIEEINIQKMELHQKRDQLSSAEINRWVNRIKQQLTLAVFNWFGAPSFWPEIYSLMYQLKAAEQQGLQDGSLREGAGLLQEKLAELPFAWIKDELSLWLGGVPEANIVLGG